jgi:hypothetical protein
MRQRQDLFHELRVVYDRITSLTEEAHRRSKQTLLGFLPKRRRLLLRVSDVWKPALDTVKNRQVPVDKVEASITETLEQLSRTNLSKNHSRRSSIMNRSRSKQSAAAGAPLPVVTEPEAFRGRVVESLLVKERMVVEAKAGNWSSWRRSFAVITVDGYLHIFPAIDPVSAGREEEGGSLADNGIAQAKLTKVSEWARDLEMNYRPPVVSLRLSRCAWVRDNDNKQLDISLGSDSHGSLASKMFQHRRVSIRLSSIGEIDRFVVAAADRPDVI